MRISHWMLFATLCAAIGGAQNRKPCETALVEYSAEREDLAKKIKLTPLMVQGETPAKARIVRSPQGTRWFAEIDPDYQSAKDPWNTTLLIHTGGAEDGVLRMDFLDHGNTFTASWINDELLFLQVWWGRFASSDLILNVGDGRLVYDRFAHYSDLGTACE